MKSLIISISFHTHFTSIATENPIQINASKELILCVAVFVVILAVVVVVVIVFYT